MKEFIENENGKFKVEVYEPSFDDMGFIENQLIVITKASIDFFLKQDNPAELISLYTFYYYTAKWQQTNLPKCTTEYTAKGLKWSADKVRKIKSELIKLGFISDFQRKDDNGKILGHYIKMKYIMSKDTEKTRLWNNQTVENQESNALSNGSLNALSNDNKNNIDSLTNVKAKKQKTLYFEKILTTDDMDNPMDEKYHEDITLKEFIGRYEVELIQRTGIEHSCLYSDIPAFNRAMINYIKSLNEKVTSWQAIRKLVDCIEARFKEQLSKWTPDFKTINGIVKNKQKYYSELL